MKLLVGEKPYINMGERKMLRRKCGRDLNGRERLNQHGIMRDEDLEDVGGISMRERTEINMGVICMFNDWDLEDMEEVGEMTYINMGERDMLPDAALEDVGYVISGRESLN